MNLEEIADISYVLLETTPNNLLGRDTREVFITENDIFINNDHKYILRFSREGNFLNVIGKKGHGPGEYTFLDSYHVNKNKQEIYLWASSQRKMFIFDYNGNFKRDFNMEVRKIAKTGEKNK